MHRYLPQPPNLPLGGWRARGVWTAAQSNAHDGSNRRSVGLLNLENMFPECGPRDVRDRLGGRSAGRRWAQDDRARASDISSPGWLTIDGDDVCNGRSHVEVLGGVEGVMPALLANRDGIPISS